MPGTKDPLRLAAVLCARLCHDLSGPLGALIGVIEIAHEEQADSETLALGEETATELAQRLKLLRAAWGPDGDELDLAALRGYAESLLTSRRVRLDLSGLAPDTVFPPPAGRVILNLLLLAAESLPGGGTVSLSGAAQDAILTTISGPRGAWPAGLDGWLADEASAWKAMTANFRTLQAPFTTILARSRGFRLSMQPPDAPPAAGSEATSTLLLSLRNG
jgi:histidine phosphotransferase ChpT